MKLFLLHAIFFLSGASALAFETLWFRQAGLTFGNSMWASSLVLSGFMGGLALGNLVAGRLGSRVASPLRVYAGLELVIAGGGVGLVFLLPQLGAWLAPLLGPLLEQPLLINPVRLGLAFTLLLVPATAMGATLPLLCQELERRGRAFGPTLGGLYGWNTLGAVFGVLIAELVGIEHLGIRGTAFAAAGCNLAIAGAALWLGHTSGEQKRSTTAPSGLPRQGRIWLVAVFGSGFALLALEVFWFRFLALYIQSRSASFALMLAAVLAGIAIGGLVASQWLRRDDEAHRYASSVAFAAGALCLLSYASAPYVLAPFGSQVIRDSFGIARVALPMMLPVSITSGIFFTLAGAALRARSDSASETAGALTFANTAGAALGSALGGFVILPALGVESAFFASALLYGAIAAMLIPRSQQARRATLAGAAAFATCTAVFPFGAMYEVHLPLAAARWSEPDHTIETIREGPGETFLLVEQRLLGQRHSQRLVTNSLSMTSNAILARRYMKLYVQWAQAVHPKLERGLLISYGLGSTAEAMTDVASFLTIDVVDISRDVLELSETSHASSGNDPLSDPRVRIHVEDGRYFLQTTALKFDLITGEPPPPAAAGVVNLYTREYFTLLRERLADGGMVTYWLPIHSLQNGATLSIVRAFCDAFGDCSLWNGIGDNLMLVGTRDATGPVTAEQFARPWLDPSTGDDLRSLGFEDPGQLGALFIAGAPYLNELTKGIPALVDDYPNRVHAKTFGPGGREAVFRSEWRDVQAARRRFATSEIIDRLWPASIRAASLRYFDWQHVVNVMSYGIPQADDNYVAGLHRVLSESSLEVLPLWLLGSDGDLQRIAAALPDDRRRLPDAQFQLALGLLARRDFARAAVHLARAEAAPEIRRDAFRLRIYALCMAGDRETAQTLARDRYASHGAQSAGPRKLPAYWSWLSEIFALDLEIAEVANRPGPARKDNAQATPLREGRIAALAPAGA